MSEFARHSIGIGMRATKSFFNVSKVTDKIDPIKRRFLFKFGAFTHTRAKRSIKPGGKKKTRSAPGEPPRTHTKFLPKGIKYAVDSVKESVVIGPIVRATRYGGPKILRTLEEGGMVSFVDIVKGKKKKFTHRMEARPFMGPAFESEKADISDTWRKAGG